MKQKKKTDLKRLNLTSWLILVNSLASKQSRVSPQIKQNPHSGLLVSLVFGHETERGK